MLSSGTTNIDSITNYKDYIALAKEYGMKAMGFSEHGNIFEWLHKKQAIEAAGMKYLHCVEAYITEDNNENTIVYTAEDFSKPQKGSKKPNRVKFRDYYNEGEDWYARVKVEYEYGEAYETVKIKYRTLKQEVEKTKDNYHCVLIAKNYEGVKEINKLVSNSFNRKDCHFYRYPRIFLDELEKTSDNIIVTSACLGGILHNGTSKAKERFINFLVANKHRCFLEIQHHNCQDQIEYNQLLYDLSQEIDVPLIAGTDTHALNEVHLDGRALLQKAKDIHFDNEDDWDLVFKSYPQLISAYQKQNSLPMDVIREAIENTNRMADMVEEFELDFSPKYPKLYPNSEEVFKQKINEGVIDRGINKYPNYKEYVDRIHYEYDVYKHNGAIDFMLLEENYKTEMRKRGIKYGYSRGSVSGSIIAYLLHITEIDSIKYNLNFERFMNKERVSLADVDTDWLSEDRKVVKDYLYSKEGLYCCDIVTFNTIAIKGAIDDVCRGFFNDNLERLPKELKERVNQFKKDEKARAKYYGNSYTPKPFPADMVAEIEKYSYHKEIPFDYVSFSTNLKELTENNEEKARKQYPNIFKYVDLLNGVVVAVGNHPAGCVVSPFPVDEWFGTFSTSNDEYPISVLNMKEIDSLNFVKLDILGLDNIGLIYKTCEAAGIPFATPDNIPADDEAVWKSIRDDTTMIFQWESKSATAYLKQLLSEETIRKIRDKNPNASYMDLLSIGNGAIRPAGESYRDKLAQGEYATYGNKALDDFLATTLGWLVYQEQIIEFLHSFCGYTMGKADVVRRGFAKKTGTEKFIPEINEGFTKTMQEKYGISSEESDKLIVNFIKVIEDASSYLFSKNHADPYSWIGYICGYLRYYYPLEFITTALNIFEDKKDKSVAIIEYAKKRKIEISPIRFRHSISKYSFDKEENTIFKGLSSVKSIGDNVAEELLKLKDNHYNNFFELLQDIRKETTVKANQLQILIELDFFNEFGDINYLSSVNFWYQNIYGRKQMLKTKAERLGISKELMSKYSEKETDLNYLSLDSLGLFKEIIAKENPPKRKLSEMIQSQLIYLGYIDIKPSEKYAGLAVVTSVNKRYTPRLEVHALKSGEIVTCKIRKDVFNKTPLKANQIIKIIGCSKKPKYQRLENGDYVPIEGTSELWLNKYKILEI